MEWIRKRSAQFIIEDRCSFAERNAMFPYVFLVFLSVPFEFHVVLYPLYLILSQPFTGPIRLVLAQRL